MDREGMAFWFLLGMFMLLPVVEAGTRYTAWEKPIGALWVLVGILLALAAVRVVVVFGRALWRYFRR